jgi:hypothetical protein
MEANKELPFEAIESFPAAASASHPQQGNTLKVYYFLGGSASAGPPVPKYLWVKYGEGDSVAIATKDCDFVSLFIKAIKKEMQLSPPPQNITLHISTNTVALDPGDELSTLASEPAGLTSKNPLIIKVKGLTIFGSIKFSTA